MTAGILALLTALFLLLPYWVGYSREGGDLHYAGTLMNPEDTQTYFGKMNQGYEGAWLYSISFTPEPHQPAFVGGFYLAVGHLARLTGTSVTQMWHISRFVAGIFMFLISYWFAGKFTDNRAAKWTAYLLILFGSGLGWLILLTGRNEWLGWLPVDFKMPEAHPFFTALTFPHIAFNSGFALLGLWHIGQTCLNDEGKWLKHALIAGILNLIIAINFPFYIYLMAGVTVIFGLGLARAQRRILWREALRLLPAFLIPLPLLLYYAYTLFNNPAFADWDEQSRALIISPHPAHYLLAFGVMLALALFALRRSPQPSKTPLRRWLLWAWLIAVCLLVYAPIDSQRRFIQGVHFPLAILSAIGLVEVVLPAFLRTRPLQQLLQNPRYTAPKLTNFLLALFLLFMSLSNLYLLASVSITAGIQQLYPFFRSQDEIAGIEWLDANSQNDELVLSSYGTGNYLSAHAGNRVMVGHWAETAHFAQRQADVARFYHPDTPDEWRQNFVEEFDIRYVWLGEQERALVGEKMVDLAGWAGGMPAFSQGEVAIYQLQQP